MTRVRKMGTKEFEDQVIEWEGGESEERVANN